MYVALALLIVLGKDCVLEFVERLVLVGGRPLAPHRQTHTLGIMQSTKLISLRRLFRVAVANRNILSSLTIAFHDTHEPLILSHFPA